MLIISCDYHPSFQQVAFVDTETGECGERKLTHKEDATSNLPSRRRSSLRGANHERGATLGVFCVCAFVGDGYLVPQNLVALHYLRTWVVVLTLSSRPGGFIWDQIASG